MNHKTWFGLTITISTLILASTAADFPQAFARQHSSDVQPISVKPLETACKNSLHLTKDQCYQGIIDGGSLLLCIPPGFLGHVIGTVARSVTGLDISCR